jgi:hypothetical protein
MDCCAQGSICFELIKSLPTALIALIVAIISYHQWRVSKAKLKLDLFDRRYEIFMKTWKILSGVVSNGTRTENLGLGTPFNNFLPEAKFLFGKDVSNYLDEVSNKWAKLHGIEGMDRASEYAAEKTVLLTYFHDQAEKGVKEVFGPYLNFDEWK